MDQNARIGLRVFRKISQHFSLKVARGEGEGEGLNRLNMAL